MSVLVERGCTRRSSRAQRAIRPQGQQQETYHQRRGKAHDQHSDEPGLLKRQAMFYHDDIRLPHAHPSVSEIIQAA
jgi:hypothetical protein